jgi:emfourin
VQVTVVRRGGLAGIALRGSLDTSQLPAAQASTAEEALRGLPAGRPAAAPTHPESFQYELTFDGRSASFDESEIPDWLHPLLDAAMVNAEIG